MQKKNIRLSRHVTPSRYDIELKPDLKNFTFEGVETIYLVVSKSTHSITLHSKEIEIETAEVEMGKEKVFGKISYNQKNETATFTFSKLVPKGKIKLSIVFKGILNDKMRGFYRSRYKIGEKEHFMATTQFEATDARRAFPCFDEPAQKAVFHVSLVVPKGKTTISNTLPGSVIEHDAGYEIVKFFPTPKMSTYLLAFIIGDFEFIEKKTNKGVLIRVYTTPGKKHQAKFALACAVKTLEFYEKYFDIAYPLNTLDMVAIPDFSAGAMENWGAITYRESALLVDEKHSSSVNKQWVALVIAHEIAHQWFGNLVTMEWWTHLWLNEGFASYIEYLAVDKLFPKWDIWTQFANNDLGVALRLDALRNTHPIEIEVHHPDEIGEIFDEVSYSKGASIIRMLAGYLGEQDFRDGLRHYLKKHSYKNTETIHLWDAFEKVSKKPVAKMMHKWTSLPGYPVLKATLEKNGLQLIQSRFFSSPASKAKAKGDTRWDIPVTIGKNKVNFGETGFFRTAYSSELLELLYEPVYKKELAPIDRLGIVRDLFALAEAGTIPTEDALQFLPAYKNEDDFTVWLEIASGFSRLEQLLPDNKELNEYILNLFSPLAYRLGWNKKPNELHATTLLRSLAVTRAGLAGNEKIIDEARNKFKMMQRGKHVPPDVRSAIYAIVAEHGGTKEYEALIKMYIKEPLHEEKNRIGNALGYFNNQTLLRNVCKFALSSDVRIQDAIGILSGVGGNPSGRDIWLQFVKTNWKILVSRYGEGGHTLGRLVKAISSSAEAKHYSGMKAFFKTHDAPGAKRAIEQVLERLEGNNLWLKRDGKSIIKFLLNSLPK
ncbi:MAG: M1 family metallopeptidase [Patescibacteria group bacterium]